MTNLPIDSPRTPTSGRTPSAAVMVLLALIVGVAVGALIQGTGSGTMLTGAKNFEIIGTIWINAIRMTVIPLVATLTIASVATSGDAAKLGRIGGYAVIVFLVLLLGSGFFTMLVAPLSLDRLDIPADVAARLRESLASTAGAAATTTMPSLSQRIVDAVPVNPIKAAADGAILPVVVFALALGLALTRLTAKQRDPLVDVCRAISDALLVLVQWVLVLAPIGVFALAVGLGAKMGGSSAGALLHYMATLAAALFAVTLLLYPIAVILGRLSPLKFAAAALPAQAVAFSTRSSLAALPAMITATRDTLKLSPRVSGFTLPLAVSIFRINVPPAWVVGLIFLGKLYGVPMSASTLAVLVVTATLLSFSVPGLPSASLFLLSPVLAQPPPKVLLCNSGSFPRCSPQRRSCRPVLRPVPRPSSRSRLPASAT
ncbi:MAG: cation:dicarboxylase symporter family transporter [Gemmatimonadetes bacterium]|nr:cation:dicarboxylase symporter family transporter [Gemmatimonadota bacterium]